MRNLCILFVTLFLLGSNVVWAYDGIDITQDHKKQNHTDAEATNHIHQDNEHQSCDHCCHGSSHFLGIFSGQPDADTTSIKRATCWLVCGTKKTITAKSKD